MADPADDPQPPDEIPASDVDLTKFSQQLAAAFGQLGKFSILTANPTKVLAEFIAMVLAIPLKLIAPVVELVALVFVDTLHQVRPQVLELATVAMGEIFPDAEIPGGPDAGPGIGKFLLEHLAGSALTGGGEGITPSAEPAAEFLGKLIGIGVNGWVLDILDFIPESFRIEALKDLNETVQRSIGIGRLARTALRPAINDGIALPLQYFVNQAVRPKLLDAGAACRAFLRGRWDRPTMEAELGNQGYSLNRQAQLIADVRPRLSTDLIRDMVDVGAWTEDEGALYLIEAAWLDSDARVLLQQRRVTQILALRQRVITAYEKKWKRGLIDDGDLANIMDSLGIDPKVASLHLEILHAERDAGLAVLDRTDLDKALAKNIISLPEWRAGYQLIGFSDGDITVVELTQRAEVTDKESAAAAKAQQKAQAAAEKKTLADQRAADKAAKAQEAAAAKAQAAQDKKTAAAQRQADLQAKQALLASQAQQRRDQLAAAKAGGLISDAQAAQELATVQAQEQAGVSAVAVHTQAQAALDAEAAKLDAADLQAQTAATEATQAGAAAAALADNQQAALLERRTERLANLQAALDVVDQEEAAGVLTATGATKKRDALHLADQAAVKQEKLDQLAIGRARLQATRQTAKAAAAAAKAEAAKALIPSAAARSAATAAAGAAALSAAKATLATSTAAARSKVAASKATATQQANAALDALLAQQLAELQAFERDHPPA